MKVELELFTVLAICLFITALILFELVNKRGQGIKKSVELRKKKCAICTSVYFIAPHLNYWRCPTCASINK
jgi:ribosomal protein S27AE